MMGLQQNGEITTQWPRLEANKAPKLDLCHDKFVENLVPGKGKRLVQVYAVYWS